ncbi:MAG: CHAT domain-containing protein [Streptosporangiaceae bacterium]
MRKRQRLLAAVYARLARFADDNDKSAVLSKDAVEDVAALLAAVAEPTADLQVLHAAGLLHWCRYLALDPSENQKDLTAALQLLTPVYRQQPNAVPDPVRRYFYDNPPDAGDGPEALADRAAQLLEQALGSGDPGTLTLAIEVGEQALAATPADHPNRSLVLSNLGAALQRRFERLGGLADLHRAIEVGEAAVAATPADHPDRAGRLSNLGAALQRRSKRLGGLADLHRAIEVCQAAVAATPPDHPNRAGRLSNLGAALQARFVRLGGLADLDRAIEVDEAVVAATPPNHRDRAMYLSNLGLALRTRFDRLGGLADLHRAIEVGEAAVAATPADHPDRAAYLSNLGGALQARFVRLGGLADLDRAIEVGEAAVAATPADHPDRPHRLASLGFGVQARFDSLGRVADLDRAIEVGEAAVAATPADHPDRAKYLTNLGVGVQTRFRRLGGLADLDRAIEVGEAAMAATPPGYPDRARIPANLGGALRTRYERLGGLADLDRAIEVGKAAVAATPPDHPDRAEYLAHLGVALRTRYERLGGLADLDRAIEVGEAAVAATPADHPDRAMYLSNLGGTLQRRFERLSTLADLDRAIEVSEAAVAATPADHPDRAMYLSNLGGILLTRFDRLGGLADLDRAIEVGKAAVAATPADHPDRAAYLSNLGAALRTRFDRLGGLADLDRAIEVGKAAVAATPADRPDRTGILSNLGVTLERQFERTGTADDRDEALAALRAAVAVKTAPASLRARAAREWGRVAAGWEDWPAAAEGFAAAIGLLARVAPRSLTRPDQEYWLGELAGLGAQASACCLQTGQVDRAVALWEQGRGVLLGQALDARTDLTGLGERHPQLAAEFIRLRDELDSVTDSSGEAPAASHAAGTSDPGRADPAAVGREIDRRRELAEDFDELVARIRAQQGFDRFLLPLPVGELLAAAAQGPVVLLNVTDIRSDALLLTTSRVLVMPLPTLTPQTVRDRTVTFLAALNDAHDPGAGRDGRDRAERELTQILGWLWDTIADPVLERLGITQPPDNAAPAGSWPRLWWVPSGLLSFLPLHAAGHHATRFDSAPQTVLDRVVSSYTPTLRALIHARRSSPTHADRGGTTTERTQLLVVAMPHTPAMQDLPGVVDEAAQLRELFRGRVTILHGDLLRDEAARLIDPTTRPGNARAEFDSVRAALLRCQWVHFACHAASYLDDPSASHLLVADYQRRPLTVLDLTRLRLEDAELAFLSSCATARTGPRLADEAIHLAAAFHLAGYRHVIATLWPVGDRPAVQLATAIYTTLATTGTAETAADALHEATRRLRAILPRKPSIWAAHLHNGA